MGSVSHVGPAALEGTTGGKTQPRPRGTQGDILGSCRCCRRETRQPWEDMPRHPQERKGRLRTGDTGGQLTQAVLGLLSLDLGLCYISHLGGAPDSLSSIALLTSPGFVSTENPLSLPEPSSLGPFMETRNILSPRDLHANGFRPTSSSRQKDCFARCSPLTCSHAASDLIWKVKLHLGVGESGKEHLRNQTTFSDWVHSQQRGLLE